jgi:transposase
MAGVRKSIDKTGAKLVYLPPYSPDYSPIEPAFSKIKQLLRGLAARTKDKLWTSMQSILDTVTQSDAEGFFKHCGYSLQDA